MKENKYPFLIQRIEAVFIDLCIYVLLMIIATQIFELFDNPLPRARIITLFSIFFMYDPIMISFCGGTIGHLMIGIRVKQYKLESKNLFVILAFFRFLVKILLGWLSFLTVSTTKEKRAIHDILSGSVVIQK